MRGRREGERRNERGGKNRGVTEERKKL